MLNALRHQRMNHSLSRQPTAWQDPCAQRLAASTNESHLGIAANEAGITGAQRLAASTNESHPRSIPLRTALIVLNALRHQRMNHHRFVRQRPNHLGRVLNALRHQRMNHPSGWYNLMASPSAQRLAASTNESHFENIGCIVAVADVLNALRHQRMNHVGIGIFAFVAILCSTPCGINE